MNYPLLTIENLKVAYPVPKNILNAKPVWAVNDVSFHLNYGEKLALVGESGCGKSSLGRSVMRLLPDGSIVQGVVNFKGESVFKYDDRQLRLFRGEAVALIFQDPMTRLDPLMTIGQHCLETLAAHKSNLSFNEAKRKVLETLASVKIPAERWSQYPHEFSGGMRQRVAIALALLLDPKLIIADEPTTSLDVTVAGEILEELTRLCEEREMALLLISHDLAMVSKFCDRVGVMYEGKLVELGDVTSIFQNPNHEYSKSLLKSASHLHNHQKPKKIPFAQVKTNTPIFLQGSIYDHYLQDQFVSENPRPLLQVIDLIKHYSLEGNLIQQLLKGKADAIKAVDGINFELYPNEVLGLVGESGCGKSTLSRTILQLIKPTSGKIKFLGQDLTTLSKTKIRALRKDIAMIFQDPCACLNPLMTIAEAIADPLIIHKIVNKKDAKDKVAQMLLRVGLTPAASFLNRYPKQLSGGQQQRVAIARALITHPKLVICDEPVSMLDATVQAQVLDLMLELKSEFNLTYLFITHDLSVARFLCDRLAVMNRGKIVEIGDSESIFTNPTHPYTKTLLNASPRLPVLNLN